MTTEFENTLESDQQTNQLLIWQKQKNIQQIEWQIKCLSNRKHYRPKNLIECWEAGFLDDEGNFDSYKNDEYDDSLSNDNESTVNSDDWECDNECEYYTESECDDEIVWESDWLYE